MADDEKVILARDVLRIASASESGDEELLYETKSQYDYDLSRFTGLFDASVILLQFTLSELAHLKKTSIEQEVDRILLDLTS